MAAGNAKNSNAVPPLPAACAPDAASHAANGDFMGRDRFADTDRNGMPQTFAATSQTRDFRSMSRAEETGEPMDIPDPFGFGMGGSVRVERTPDPWGIQRPIGGTPDPNVGNPRP